MSHRTKVGSFPDETGVKLICRSFEKMHFKSVKKASGNTVNMF